MLKTIKRLAGIQVSAIEDPKTRLSTWHQIIDDEEGPENFPESVARPLKQFKLADLELRDTIGAMLGSASHYT